MATKKKQESKATQYRGRPCPKHPELRGLRRKSAGGTSRCVGCARDKAQSRTRGERDRLMRDAGYACELCGVDDRDVLSVQVAENRLLCMNCNTKAHRYNQRTGATLRTRPNYVALRTLQREITQWADSVYPHRTLESILLKLREEAQELIDKPLDGLEVADVVICLLDLASKAGVDVYDATHRKIVMNNKRRWEISEETGVMRHVDTD